MKVVVDKSCFTQDKIIDYIMEKENGYFKYDSKNPNYRFLKIQIFTAIVSYILNSYDIGFSFDYGNKDEGYILVQIIGNVIDILKYFMENSQEYCMSNKKINMYKECLDSFISDLEKSRFEHFRYYLGSGTVSSLKNNIELCLNIDELYRLLNILYKKKLNCKESLYSIYLEKILKDDYDSILNSVMDFFKKGISCYFQNDDVVWSHLNSLARVPLPISTLLDACGNGDYFYPYKDMVKTILLCRKEHLFLAAAYNSTSDSDIALELDYESFVKETVGQSTIKM